MIVKYTWICSIYQWSNWDLIEILPGTHWEYCREANCNNVTTTKTQNTCLLHTFYKNPIYKNHNAQKNAENREFSENHAEANLQSFKVFTLSPYNFIDLIWTCSLPLKNQYSPFDACDRTRTRQHTRHYFDAC